MFWEKLNQIILIRKWYLIISLLRSTFGNSWIRMMCLSRATCPGLGLLFQMASIMKIQQSVLFLSTADNLVIISLKLTCSFHDIAEALFICRYASINRSLKAREIVLVVIVRDSWKSENITSMYWCLCFSPGIRGFLNQCFKYRFKDWLIVCC